MKQDLASGSLDEDGDEIEYVYSKTEIKPGTYEISISSKSNDFYKIEGTDYYVRFTSYYGYSYAQEGILEVNYYGGTFYEKP